MSSQYSIAGIGLCFVRLAQANGAGKVIIADINLTEEAHELIQADNNIVYLNCDVTKWHDLQALIDFSNNEFSDVPDVFVPCAGVLEPPNSGFWQDPEPLEANGYSQVDINVNHPKIKLTRLAIRALLKRNKPGVVVLLGSVAGHSSQYLAPIYCATKHAIWGFTKSMADTEKHQNVRVVSVCPGIVSTPQWTDGSPSERFRLMSKIAISPEDVARVMHQAIIEPLKYPGGTVLEVTVLGTRVIPPWNMDPPGMKDGIMTPLTDIPAEAIAIAMKPIFDITAAERGVDGV
ncbi:hypothetical protein N7528_002077 [Penicillium herquei]|nr:hypothetical protein N7528_002077 [Penicillium herquei]